MRALPTSPEPSVRDDTPAVFASPDDLLLRGILARFERSVILIALNAAGGSQVRAAGALGILPTTLQEKLRRLGLHPRRRSRRRSRSTEASLPGARDASGLKVAEPKHLNEDT